MTPIPPRVLVIDGEELARRGLRQEFERAGCAVVEAPSLSAGLEAAARDAPDVVWLDLRSAARSGSDGVRDFARLHPRLPVVAVAAGNGLEDELAVGACERLVEPFELPWAVSVVRRAAEASLLREQLARVRDHEGCEAGLRHLVAQSPAMKNLVPRLAREAAKAANAILLVGERGVGLRTIAHALHAESSAREQPFFSLACSAMSEPELEAELFGRERIAGAPRRGLLELAGEGTVFLDDVDRLPLALQARLMRALELRVFRRVGGSRDLPVRARIVAAARTDLPAGVRSERFRRDLYEALAQTTLEAAPLRFRREDVRPLAHLFLQRFGREFGKALEGFADGVEERFVAYDWPGNVRELRNTVERAALLAKGAHITPADLPAAMSLDASSTPGDGGFVLPEHGLVFAELEKHLLCQALERSRGNRTHAARLLGLNRDRIRYRIQKFGLEKFALEPQT